MSEDLLGALAAGRLDPSAPASAPSARAPRPGAREAHGVGGAPCCSSRGCRGDAAWALEWNNPRVHAPDRIKTWVACDDHRARLRAFLDDRGLLRRERPLDAPAGVAPPDEPPTDGALS